jgi:hypothetical protein
MDIRKLFANLSDAEFSQESAIILSDVISEIKSKLRGFDDFSPVQIPYNPVISVAEDMMRLGCIRLLTDNKIIHWNPEDEGDGNADYAITVVNRYTFEKLSLRAAGLSEKEIDKQLPNLVYYNPLTGMGFVNGNPIRLKPKSKRKAKELFDALFAAAPDSVPRKKLAALLRINSDTKIDRTYVAQELSFAFTNLRKRCHVNSEVIELDVDGKLNAHTTLLNKLPEFYIFPE